MIHQAQQRRSTSIRRKLAFNTSPIDRALKKAKGDEELVIKKVDSRQCSSPTMDSTRGKGKRPCGRGTLSKAAYTVPKVKRMKLTSSLKSNFRYKITHKKCD